MDLREVVVVVGGWRPWLHQTPEHGLQEIQKGNYF